MPTKTEYREYIAGEQWRQRRREFIEVSGYNSCNRCGMPRWLVVVAYDQDLHVHHKSYARVGEELDEDLESLCRRCHEVETFGKSDLHKPKQVECEYCATPTWNIYDRRCEVCNVVVPGGANEVLPPVFGDPLILENILWSMYIGTSADAILDLLVGMESRRAELRKEQNRSDAVTPARTASE